MREDIRWGITIGLRMALFYSVIGGLISAIGGASEEETFLLVAAYFGAGIVSGFLLGLFKRLALRSRAMSMFLGVIIAFPALLLLSPIAFQGDEFSNAHARVGSIVTVAVILGLWGGWYFGPGGPGYSGDTPD